LNLDESNLAHHSHYMFHPLLLTVQ
jgi:hypothetical protein